MRSSLDIRRTLLGFFEQRDHLLMPSSSLIPDDPSLLLTTAGMVQFLPYFTGERTPPAPRLTTSQRCVRTVDVDNIGSTDRHTTYFEMFGNFSFGDYDAPQAVAWAWELFTEHLGIDRDRLWVTVYLDDDDTVEIWRSLGVPIERIQRLGMEENYWSVGRPGPCGPCTEIFYDRGPSYGPDGGPAVDTDRFLELGNVVLMRHVRGEGGTDDDFPVVGDLPRPGIDVGLGLERIAMVLQDARHIHEIDSFRPSLDHLVGLTSVDDVGSVRVVVDHLHATAMLVADGVLPSAGGRGHVLRRLIRRALGRLRRLDLPSKTLTELVPFVIEGRLPLRPDLVDARPVIESVLTAEIEAFDRALRQGSRLLRRAIRRTLERSETVLPGESAFELYDACGMPLELTIELAHESGLSVDVERFEELMAKHRQVSGG